MFVAGIPSSVSYQPPRTYTYPSLSSWVGGGGDPQVADAIEKCYVRKQMKLDLSDHQNITQCPTTTSPTITICCTGLSEAEGVLQYCKHGC